MGKKKAFHLLRTSLTILIVCAIVGLGLTGVLFFTNPDPTYASATLQLSFDGAAQGILPNGAQFDVRELATDEILNQALEATGLTGTYTAEQIRNNLVITGVYPEDIVEEAISYESLLDFTANRKLSVGDYYPTTFGVSLKNGFDPSISGAKLMELLKGIMTAYQAQFIRSGSVALDAEDPILAASDKYDYPQQLLILGNHLSWVAESANEMYEKETTFRYNGIGFNDISVQLNNLNTNNTTQLNAEITMNALTKDTERLLTQYQFEIRDLNNQAEKQNARLTQLDNLIKAYEKNEIIYLSTADTLTKIDGNSSETYDKLMEERRVVTDLIAEIRSRISTYTLRMNDLMGKTVENQDTAGEPTEEVAAVTAAADTVPAEAEPAPAEDAAGTGEAVAAEDMQELNEKEIKEAAQQAEELNKARIEALEKNIAGLKEKAAAIFSQYREMLAAFNAEKLNEMSVAITNCKYTAPKVLSGAFVKKAIKTAGPICLTGLLAVLMMLFIVNRRKMRAEEA